VLNDLKYYFELVTTFRSSTSNIIVKRAIILSERLPDLMHRTRSNRLKMEIGKFLQENADAIRTDKRR
jgi:hypothetical protein